MGDGVDWPERPERRCGSADRDRQNATVRAWMTAYLAALRPAPDQLPDTRLGDHIGLLKGRGMRFYGRTARLERQPHGTIISAVIDCAGASPQALRRAFRRAARRAVDQQMDKAQRQAGVLLDAEVAEDGRVGLRALITDPTAAAKALHAVYSGLLVELDGDEIDGISLIDAPGDFVTKASGGAQVIAKIFTRKGVSKVEPVPVYTKKYLKLMRRQAVQGVLRKAGGLSAKEQEAVNFALTHKMDGKDRETDFAVFKALYGASISANRRPGQRIVGSTLDLLTGGR